MRETEGQHTMKVDLDNLPDMVTDLFFVLAAYNCDDISLFPSPSVQLFDGDRPDNQLTEYNIEKAGRSQAVVMCALSRANGPWNVQAFGVTCGGNVLCYTPIEAQIALLQARHQRWEARGRLLKMYLLWGAKRMMRRQSCDNPELADLVERLFKSGPNLFRVIVKFLGPDVAGLAELAQKKTGCGYG